MESRNKVTMCRLCLCENVDFVDVFEMNDLQGYVAAELISNLLQCRVSASDGYPRVVCSTCLTKLTDFKLFKEFCQKSKETYDKMFISSDGLVKQRPVTPVIKPEEIEISGDENEESFVNNTEGFAPLILKQEMFTVFENSHQQEDFTDSEGIENVDVIDLSATSMEDSPQVKLPLVETVTHPTYTHCLENEIPHSTSKGEIEAESSSLSISTNDELIFERTECISLSQEVEASSSETAERLEYQTILPGESMDMAPLIILEKERVRMDQDIGKGGEGLRRTITEKEVKERREGLECFHCGIVLMNKLLLTRHMKEHGLVNSYDCAECGKVFHFNSQFKRHLLSHFMSKPHKCAESSNCISQTSDDKRHMRLHIDSKLYKCAECSRSFSRSSNLNSHMILHTGSKPFKCAECGKSFSRNGDLKTHIRLHTGCKPYKCTECSKSFSQSSHLNTHMIIHTGSKPYKCTECSQNFSRSSNLNTHLRVHTGSKPYKCAECGKSFSQNGSLKKHLRIHTGSKPYKCEECSKSFSDCSNKKKHMRTHTGAKPYKCAVWGKNYSQSSSLKKHIKIHRF